MKNLDAATLDEYGIPAYMQPALISWVNHGVRPGSFLTAVLENNLMEAVGRADNTNALHLKDYAAFLYNAAPSDCHGSTQKVDAWELRLSMAHTA